MKIIFSINGGIGKVIAATAVCKAIHKKYPDDKLIVISGYPDVFLNNSNVFRSYGFGQQSYFYSEHIDTQEIKLFCHDPYNESEYIKEEKHLIEIWCNMFDIPYDNELPEVFLTERELNFNKQRFTSDKDILLLHTNGGADNQLVKYSWARDLPSGIVVKVIEHFKEKYNIVHIRREDQIAYEFTNRVMDNYRNLVALIGFSKKRLFIDSFAQHTAASLNLPSTVAWIVNKPEVLGYKIHDNIICNKFTKEPELRNSFFSKFDISGDVLQFPYNSENDIFNIDQIIKSLEK